MVSFVIDWILFDSSNGRASENLKLYKSCDLVDFLLWLKNGEIKARIQTTTLYNCNML